MDNEIRFMTLQEQQEYAKALTHWKQQFRDGTLSEKFGEQIAGLLERTAADITEREWIRIEWHVDDVLEQRPDLTKEQAKEVLHTLKRDHDADLGINWEVIYWTADAIYPKELEL